MYGRGIVADREPNRNAWQRVLTYIFYIVAFGLDFMLQCLVLDLASPARQATPHDI